MTLANNQYKTMDSKLALKLFSYGHQLPRQIVDEFIRQGDAVVPFLGNIASSEKCWQFPSPYWWSVVHSTFILGAIGTEATIPYLMDVCILASEYECLCVSEELESIYGALPPVAIERLEKLAGNRSLGFDVRMTAIGGMAAITIKHPKASKYVFDYIARIVADQSDDKQTRYVAGGILLDFCQGQYRELLLKTAEEQEDKKIWNDTPDFTKSWVRQVLKKNKPYLKDYTSNWLKFYNKSSLKKWKTYWEDE